jgi:hypothetical protein
MSNNLFVIFKLHSSNNQVLVNDVIRSLGNWAEVSDGNWFVNSTYNSREACELIQAVMHQNDVLTVIDASNNSVDFYNVIQDVSCFVQEKWPG